MADIIKFPEESIEFKIIDNVRIRKPQNRKQYQDICKNLLEKDDYEDLLLCIMDREYYDNSENWIKNIVDCYYDFED